MDITPTKDLFPLDYGQVFGSVHDPVYARALVLDNGFCQSRAHQPGHQARSGRRRTYEGRHCRVGNSARARYLERDPRSQHSDRRWTGG